MVSKIWFVNQPSYPGSCENGFEESKIIRGMTVQEAAAIIQRGSDKELSETVEVDTDF